MMRTVTCKIWFPILVCSVLLAGCATSQPFPTQDLNLELTPREAVQLGDDADNEQVLWGGRVIDVRPLEQGTQLELLAYPLTRDQQPDLSRSSLGRFLVLHPDYLEPVDWAVNRLVTVRGRIDGIREGRIGEADYQYPMVVAEDALLWPERDSPRADTSPRVRLGIGVMFSR